MAERILVMNMGSTSSKIAVYDADKELFTKTLRHSAEEMAQFDGVIDQLEFRKAKIFEALEENGITVDSLAAACSRGGNIIACPHGAIEIDQEMVDYLTRPEDTFPHASLLGSLIAWEIKKEHDVLACIYDAIGTDEMQPVARVTGVPDIPRYTVGHTLNTRAMGIKVAEEKLGKKFDDCNMIVAHLGGGSSVRLFEQGVNIDCVNDDEGNFTPERGGGVSSKELVKYCFKKFNEGLTDKQVTKAFHGQGGLMAWLGTTDARDVEAMIAEGNDKAKVVYEAMGYNVAKDIARLSAVVCGKVDAIVLTGGIAYSKALTSQVEKMVSWIAPVHVMAGEYEMEALSSGALRVLRGEENLQNFGEIKAAAADRVKIY